MEKDIIEFVKTNGLIEKNDSILAGVSGGADSVCLLLMLNNMKELFSLKLFVLHINHQIRGKEADEDEEYVKKLCGSLAIPFEACRCDVKGYAAEQKLSTEEAGRILRYDCFEQYAKKHQCTKIAVAHHKDDSVETILLNLFRGSGLAGLTGIEPKRGKIIRPLLCIGRKQIEEYLKEKQISYCTDRTNLETDYTRNKVRNELIPYIEENINSEASAHILQAAKRMQEADDFFDRLSEGIFEKYAQKEMKMVILETEGLKNQPEPVKAGVLLKCISELVNTKKDITSVHLQSLQKLLVGNTGKQIHLPYQILAEKSYQRLIFSVQDVEERQEEGDFPPHLEFEIKNFVKNQIIPTKTYTKWIDYDKIKFTLQTRHRESRDRIVVNAAGGSKKLKDYFIDEKIPRGLRDKIWVLADGTDIVWVIGYRLSEAYKVTEDTKKIMQITADGGEYDGKN